MLALSALIVTDARDLCLGVVYEHTFVRVPFCLILLLYNLLLYKYTGAPLPPFQLSSPQASPVKTATTEPMISASRFQARQSS